MISFLLDEKIFYGESKVRAGDLKWGTSDCDGRDKKSSSDD